MREHSVCLGMMRVTGHKSAEKILNAGSPTRRSLPKSFKILSSPTLASLLPFPFISYHTAKNSKPAFSKVKSIFYLLFLTRWTILCIRGCLSYAFSVSYLLPIRTGRTSWARVLISLFKKEKLDRREGHDCIKNNLLWPDIL